MNTEAKILREKNDVLRAALDKADRRIAQMIEADRRKDAELAAAKEAAARGAAGGGAALADVRQVARLAALREAADLAAKAASGMDARRAIMDVYFRELRG